MSMSPLDIDLPQPTAKPLPQKILERRRSFRDIQSGISKINPQLLKSLISYGSLNKSLNDNNGNELPSYKPFSVPSTPKEHHLHSYPPLPVFIPTFRPFSTSETAAFTIFYNGTVAVFDVPPHKAESIIKLAQEAGSQSESTDSELAISSSMKHQLLETLNRDLPITRRKSLQRFLEKRKERLTMVSSPSDFTTTTKHPSSAQNSPLP